VIIPDRTSIARAPPVRFSPLGWRKRSAQHHHHTALTEDHMASTLQILIIGLLILIVQRIFRLRLLV
jgi:hypothetical protein